MLTERGKQIRRDVIALSSAHGGYHYGGCFSCVEILSVLYDRVMDPAHDVCILSKGHACWTQYVLLREQGLDPRLEGHPHRDPHQGVYATTGSLGHGLPIGLGMAMGKAARSKPGRVFVVMGDGECQEGTTWESLLIAGHRGVDNLTVVVDWNGIQGSGFVDDVLSIRGLRDTAANLGWGVHEVDGHDVEALEGVMVPEDTSPNCRKPQLVMARTVKGYGVSFMEDKPQWHANWLGGDELAQALEELR